MRYWLCPGRTDMRKGISSLCGVVHERMKSEVRNGDVFIFIGRDLKLMKLLHQSVILNAEYELVR